MTFQTHDNIGNAPAVLTDEQRQRVADALESSQSDNTRNNYASQLRQFQSWCQQENYSPLQALQTHGRWKSPSMPARYTRSEKALEAA